MNELTKLEVGKTYVFKDELSKQGYINREHANETLIDRHYRDGFTIYKISSYGSGESNGGQCCLISPMEKKYFKLKEENVMPIKPEDEVTITTTYRELARLYVILGKANGTASGGLFAKLKSLLDIGGDKYNKLIRPMTSAQDILNYNKYQVKWESMLFVEQETQQQIQIRELREQAEALLEKAKELEGGVL